jgi:hypothetical protein
MAGTILNPMIELTRRTMLCEMAAAPLAAAQAQSIDLPDRPLRFVV